MDRICVEQEQIQDSPIATLALADQCADTDDMLDEIGFAREIGAPEDLRLVRPSSG